MRLRPPHLLPIEVIIQRQNSQPWRNGSLHTSVSFSGSPRGHLAHNTPRPETTGGRLEAELRRQERRRLERTHSSASNQADESVTEQLRSVEGLARPHAAAGTPLLPGVLSPICGWATGWPSAEESRESIERASTCSRVGDVAGGGRSSSCLSRASSRRCETMRPSLSKSASLASALGSYKSLHSMRSASFASTTDQGAAAPRAASTARADTTQAPTADAAAAARAKEDYEEAEEELRRMEAATTLAAWQRGKAGRRRSVELRSCKEVAALRIQAAWRAHMLRARAQLLREGAEEAARRRRHSTAVIRRHVRKAKQRVSVIAAGPRPTLHAKSFRLPPEDLVVLGELAKRVRDERWRGWKERTARVTIAWLLNFLLMGLLLFWSVLLCLMFGDRDVTQIVASWLIAFAATALIVEPVQILLLAAAPLLFSEGNACGRCMQRVRFVYNEYFSV